MVKKTPRIPQSKVWDKEDINHLLAWFDHPLQHDDIDFDQTIEGYLKESRGGKIFTITQIKSRLYRTWQTKRGYPDGPKRVIWQDELYIHGSTCLVGLSAADKESIALLVKRLEDEYAARYRFPRYRLRSSSTLEERRTNSNVSIDASRTKSPNTARSQQTTGDHSVIASAIKRETDKVERDPLEGNRSSKRQRRANPTHLTVSDTDESLSNRKANDYQAKLQKDRLMAASGSYLVPAVEDSEEERSDTIEEGGPVEQGNFAPAPEAGKVSLHNEDDVLDLLLLAGKNIQKEGLGSDETRSQSPSYCVRLQAAVAEIRELREELRGTNLQLRRKEDAFNKLESEVELLKSAQSQYDCRDRERLRQLIADNDREIRDLKDAMRDREAITTFSKISSQSGVGHFVVDVARDFREIYYECNQICYKHASLPPLFNPVLANHKNLRDLVYGGLGIKATGAVAAPDVLRQLNFFKLSIIAIVRHLTATALRLWIFETDFPQLDSPDSALLAEYKKQLVNLDGPLALRKLDLSAHHSLIKNKEFQEYRIQQPAADLAIKLSETLAPFFSPGFEDKPGLSGGEFANWNQDQEDCQERRRRLEDIFSRAYLLKAESILNHEYYEMVLCPPDTRFDRNFMTPETADGFDIDVGDGGDRLVAVCITCAVFAYPKDKLVDESSVQEAVVQSRNFISGPNGLRQSARLVLKATVILKEQKQDK